MAASASNSNPLLEHLEDGKNYDLEFGDTWNSTIDGSNSKYSYHTIKYDFKPASVMKSDQAELTIGSAQDVTITLPNVEGSSTKFSGNTKSYAPKECLMIIDPQTGKIVLERLTGNVRVKNVRTENRPANPVVKPTATRTNPTEPPGEKKTTKAPTTTTTTTTVTAKSTTQKSNNPTKPTVTAPVKPMPNKKGLSPLDLSDEESSSETEQPPPPPPPVLSHPPPIRRSSHGTLEQDLHLSDSSDEELI